MPLIQSLFQSETVCAVCVLWELRALLLPWSRGEGEGRRAGAAHLGAGSLCQQSRLLGELLGKEVDVVELKVDSKSALALAKNPVFHDRSKHIRIKYHFIRDCLEDGSIKTSHIPTTDQLADILTKSLGKPSSRR